jgi:hypothetical protein
MVVQPPPRSWTVRSHLTFSSTTITLSCLASAASFISFGVLDQHHESHYSINENFVPTEFLTLVSTALIDSYPRTETLELFPGSQGVSPGVYDLLASLDEVIKRVPAEFAWAVIEPLQYGLSTWFSDESHVISEERAAQVGKVLLLSSHFPVSSEGGIS